MSTKDTKVTVAEHVVVDLPVEGLQHKGRPVARLTGKVAVEVELDDAKLVWARTLDRTETKLRRKPSNGDSSRTKKAFSDAAEKATSRSDSPLQVVE